MKPKKNRTVEEPLEDLKPNLYVYQHNEKVYQPTLNSYIEIGGVDNITLDKEMFEEKGTENIVSIIGDIRHSIVNDFIKSSNNKKIYSIELGGFKKIDSIRFERKKKK